MKNSSWLMFLSGFAVGAAVIWLTSTDEGKKIVVDIKEKINDGIDKLDKSITDLVSEIDEISSKL